MSLKSKKEFLLKNQSLSIEELAVKTGLSPRQVQKFLDSAKENKKPTTKSQEDLGANAIIPWRIALIPVFITFIFYFPILHNDFVYWDDPAFITQNQNIRSMGPHFFHWILTSFDTGNWMPLSWLSLAIDYHLVGLNPKIFHLTNLLLHGMNTALVFILGWGLLRIAYPPKNDPGEPLKEAWINSTALLTAILFGLHPIHVESVAWAAERRDLLYSLFYLLSLLFYLDYATRPGRPYIKLWVCFGFFLLSLMSKPMAVTLPLILLVLDFWPLRRFQAPIARIELEKIPFGLASLVIGLFTISAQSKTGAMGPEGGLPLLFRIMNAFHSLAFYGVKIALPTGLVPFYPILHPQENPFTTVNIGSFLLVLLLSIFCWRQRRNRPYLAAAWLFYMISLAPTLGILQVGLQAAGDRFTYLPSLGLFLLVTSVATKFLLKNRAVFFLFFSGLTLALGAGTWSQLGLWKNSITLCDTVVRDYPDVSQLAQTYLGQSYEQAGRLQDALREYDRALAIPPPNPHILDLKGSVLLQLGQVDEAIQAFKAATILPPVGDPTVSYQSLWLIYQKKGLQSEALSVIATATRIDPTSAPCWYYLGISDWYAHEYEKSEEAFRNAARLEPNNAEYRENLAIFLQKKEKGWVWSDPNNKK